MDGHGLKVFVNTEDVMSCKGFSASWTDVKRVPGRLLVRAHGPAETMGFFCGLVQGAKRRERGEKREEAWQCRL